MDLLTSTPVQSAVLNRLEGAGGCSQPGKVNDRLMAA